MKSFFRILRRFFLLLTISANAQNLVPNPSFEQHTQCPNSYNQVLFATGWKSSYQNNVNPHHTEYLHACGSGGFQTPSNVWGNQAPATGQAYMGIATLSTAIAANYRENIYIELITPLAVGVSYRLSYKVSHTDNSSVGSNRLGMKLSTGETFLIDNQSHMWSPVAIYDKVNWVSVSDTIVADSAYKFVAVGNFFTDANTTVQTICAGCPLPHSVYYLDDIEVVPLCSVTSSYSVSQNVCVNDTVSFINNSVGGSIFEWDFGDGNTSTLTEPLHSFNLPGTYTTELIASGSCGLDTSFVIIQVNPEPVVNIVGNTNVCSGSSSVLTSTGATFYSWEPSGSLNVLSGSQVIATPFVTTTYTVTGTTAACSATSVITVDVIPLPIINAGSDISICPGSTVSLNGTGGTSYLWNPPGTLSNPSSPNTSASPLSTTTYTLTGISNNCSGTDLVVVNVTPILITAGSDLSVCSGDSVLLQASGGNSYSWFPSNSLSAYNISGPIASPLSTTTYTVTGSLNGCGMVDEVIVQVTPLPTVNAAGTSQICEGTSVPLNASGGNSYSWFPASGLSDPNISNPIATPLSSTTYTVSGIINGCSDTSLVFIDVIPFPFTSSQDENICEGNSVALTASGASYYEWSPSATLSGTSVSNPIASPLSTTTYTVTGTSANCMAIEEVIVNVKPLPLVNAGLDRLICSGSDVQLVALGADTFQWTPDASLSDLSVSDPLASPITSTTYTVTGTTNGCTAISMVYVLVVPGITVKSTSGNICNSSTLTLVAENAATYEWSPSSSLSSFSGSSVIASPAVTTTYTVTGTSSNGCTDTSLSVVRVITVNPVASDKSVCEGESVIISAAGATAFSWSPVSSLNSGFGSSVISTPTATTTYTITGTTENCHATGFSIVTVRPVPVADFTAEKTAACPGSCFRMNDLSVVSDNSIVSWEWYSDNALLNTSQNPNLCFSDTGKYNLSLVAQSFYGCSDTITRQHFIQIYNSPDAEFVTDQETYSILNPTVCVENRSSSATEYLWNFNHNLLSYESDEASPCRIYGDTGTYCILLTAMNEYDCIDTALKCISIYEEPVIYFPNSFTPNGDDLNDHFRPVGRGVSEYELLIFDRWGELIFSTNDFNQGWNGRKNNHGTYMQQDVYLWKAKYVTDKFRKAQGTVTVVF